MNERKIYPESYYSVDNNMSLEKLLTAKRTGNFVVGKVICWSEKTNCLHVELGNEYKGILPLEQVTIYSVSSKNGGLAPTVYSLIGKTICACVMDVVGYDYTVHLSRKENMLKTLNYLSEDDIVEAHVTSVYPTYLYADIGHGISGFLYINQFITSRLKHMSDIGIYKGSNIRVKVLSIDKEKFFVDINYKDCFDDLSVSYEHGDIIEVMVLNPVEDKDGYFAYINPKTAGILNFSEKNEIPLEYGDKVIALVVNAKGPGKLKLRFLSKS